MKTLLFAACCSVASLFGVATTANAAETLSALKAEDFAFCLHTDAGIIISDSVATEVGVVVTDIGNNLTGTSGTIVIAANNFYGKGAGGEWKSAMGRFDLAGGHCYSIATMNKTTSPSAGMAWTCAATNGAASAAGATITGVISTQTQVTPIATAYVLAGVSSTLNNAPVVNCY